MQPTSTPGRMVLLEMLLHTGDADEVSTFLARVRQALSLQGGGTINVALVREQDGA